MCLRRRGWRARSLGPRVRAQAKLQLEDNSAGCSSQFRACGTAVHPRQTYRRCRARAGRYFGAGCRMSTQVPEQRSRVPEYTSSTCRSPMRRISSSRSLPGDGVQTVLGPDTPTQFGVGSRAHVRGRNCRVLNVRGEDSPLRRVAGDCRARQGVTVASPFEANCDAEMAGWRSIAGVRYTVRGQ